LIEVEEFMVIKEQKLLLLLLKWLSFVNRFDASKSNGPLLTAGAMQRRGFSELKGIKSSNYIYLNSKKTYPLKWWFFLCE
jgi:hypothetical protein